MVEILQGDCRDVLATLDAESIHCCVTSPPYFGLRDYGVAGQIGLETSVDEYIAQIVDVFRAVRRVLRDDGTLWLNLGDSYAGSWGAQGREGAMADRSVVSARQIEAHPKRKSKTGSVAQLNGIKAKELIGIPWRVAFALSADGWYLRQDIIWHKPNPMPESIKDRCTKAHEYIFLLSKRPRYYFNSSAIQERGTGRAGGNTKPIKGVHEDPIKHSTRVGLLAAQQRAREFGGFEFRNKRSVWTITTKPYKGAHFATYPPDLIEPCILAGCPEGGTVVDPFAGSGTTGAVAAKHNRNAILCELNPKYVDLAWARVGGEITGGLV